MWLLVPEVEYDVDDDGQGDADDQHGHDGEIEGEVVLLDEYITRQLAQEGYVLAEHQQQPDNDNHPAGYQQYFTQSRQIHREILA